MFFDKLIQISVDSLKSKIIFLYQEYENGTIDALDPEESWVRKAVRILRSSSRVVFRYLVKDMLTKSGYKINEGFHDYMQVSKDGKSYLVLPYNPVDYFSFDDLVDFSSVGDTESDRVVITSVHSQNFSCPLGMRIISGSELVNLIVTGKGLNLSEK